MKYNNPPIDGMNNSNKQPKWKMQEESREVEISRLIKCDQDAMHQRVKHFFLYSGKDRAKMDEANSYLHTATYD